MRINLLFIALLLTVHIQAQTQQTTPNINFAKTSHRVNLSLWKNIATQPTDTTSATAFNLGIYSSMNRLDGLSVNILSSVVGRNMNGMQIAGLSNMTGGSMTGLQIAGICNVNGNNLTGVSVAGLVSLTGNEARGLLASSIANIAGENSAGLVIGGLMNICGENAAGVHLGGITNIAGGNFRGVALAGLLGVAGGSVNGVQISGLGNITAEDLHGIQVSALLNVTGKEMTGLQLSPVNMAIRAKGLQIGLVNYYKENLDGFQLGLVNANPNTRIQPMIFGGTATKFNAGVRFKNNLYYTILGAGTHYLDLNDKFSASFFYRAGIELPLYKQLFISGDLGYQHIETFRNKDYGYPARLYALQARVNLEYRFNEKIGVFLTGGYGGSRYYNKGVTYDKGIIVEGGVVLLSFK